MIFVGNMDELNKYLKFLSLKFSQAIVQSRLGLPIATKCNSSGTDWVSRVVKCLKIDFVGDKQRSLVYKRYIEEFFRSFSKRIIFDGLDIKNGEWPCDMVNLHSKQLFIF